MSRRNSRSVTREDVAREAGTSAAVVSYVVNGGPRPVAESTRARVLAAIDLVGYTPNSIAQALASGVSGTYGLIVPDISNPFFAALAHELADEVSAHGKVLLLGDSAESKEREQLLLRMFLRQQIDGALFIGVDSAPEVEGAINAKVPVVMLDRADQRGEVSSVAVDNVAGAEAATKHLIEHGYQKIGIIAGPSHLFTARDRRRGWEAALETAKLQVDLRWCLEAPFSRSGGLDAGNRLFGDDELPEAIFASNEQQALGLLLAAARHGIRVPQELAVISFDGTDDSEYSHPSISTVVQPLKDIARAAVGLLNRNVHDGVLHTTCDYSLRLRSSCGAHSQQSTSVPYD
ncbi:LacI family DNA-binding transcriptional regulator [Arthrobacter sp. E3]|uniref:LacI family DNA-binding transcriptional regulator n=1 Tax=Arthrobacter sp. E3 TaxID=517402 RepID=UPI001A948AA0|nr:LacI family DNA-binding transcriptional regulator [Arthrobacter sp. E3]